MKKITISVILAIMVTLAGCNFSPLSPSNRPNIRNNGEIGDIKNNQQGIMLEMMQLKNRMDIIARDIENMQNGFINHNNKNNGVQILQGDGGLLFALCCMAILAIVAISYKLKSDKYRKTAEIFGKQVKKMNSIKTEEDILMAAMEKKVEVEAFRILNANQSKSYP